MDSPVVERIPQVSDSKRQKLEGDEIFEDDNSSSSSEDYDENDVRMWDAEYERSGDYDFDFTRIGRYKDFNPVNFNDSTFAEEPETDEDFVGHMCKAALKKYNHDKGTNLEFARALRANFHPSAGFTFCISFEAKDASEVKPFHARVRYLSEEFFVCDIYPAKP
ncbi:unnamed protein product [Microthlaspi erraticum]|uniref:Cystatin domain-containing protein n=1 Tax=Microthlaspi erraticum TaxID=1685480 RepID=A0A6D2KLF0_9BRAS|nr:unnamed protein product [Microthlaspi erraticum]